MIGVEFKLPKHEHQSRELPRIQVTIASGSLLCSSQDGLPNRAAKGGAEKYQLPDRQSTWLDEGETSTGRTVNRDMLVNPGV